MVPFDDDALPFAGLTILDLSSILAGPLTGSFFAELGAKVVKIENKTIGGDATRQWKLSKEDPSSPYSAYYHSANYGKEVVLLDLTDENDKNTLRQYLSISDVVIMNFQKQVAQKLELLPDNLHIAHPKLIIAQLSAYEYDDPRAGYDLVMQGETGWISMNGTANDQLSKLPVALIDIIASHQLKEAILIALWKKAVHQLGSIIHVSLFKSALSALANQASNYLNTGHIASPIGTLHPNIAPYGDLFYDKNGQKFLLAIGSDAQFKKLWDTLNICIENYHIFEFNSDRLKNRTELRLTLQQSFSAMDIDDIATKLDQEKLPFCTIKNIAQVLDDSDAQSMILKQNVDGLDVRSMRSIAFYFK